MAGSFLRLLALESADDVVRIQEFRRRKIQQQLLHQLMEQPVPQPEHQETTTAADSEDGHHHRRRGGGGKDGHRKSFDSEADQQEGDEQDPDPVSLVAIAEERVNRQRLELEMEERRRELGVGTIAGDPSVVTVVPEYPPNVMVHMPWFLWILKNRYMRVIWAVLFGFLTTAFIYGWQKLSGVLFAERLFIDKCTAEEIALAGSTADILDPFRFDPVCAGQDSAVQTIYLLTSAIEFIGGVVVGLFLDALGPGLTAGTGVILIVVGEALLGMGLRINPYLSYVCAVVTGVATSFVLYPASTVAEYFPDHRGLLISIIVGSQNASTAIMVILSAIYQNQQNPDFYKIITFFTFAIVLPVGFFFTLSCPLLRPEQNPCFAINEEDEALQRKGGELQLRTIEDKNRDVLGDHLAAPPPGIPDDDDNNHAPAYHNHNHNHDHYYYGSTGPDDDDDVNSPHELVAVADGDGITTTPVVPLFSTKHVVIADAPNDHGNDDDGVVRRETTTVGRKEEAEGSDDDSPSDDGQRAGFYGTMLTVWKIITDPTVYTFAIVNTLCMMYYTFYTITQQQVLGYQVTNFLGNVIPSLVVWSILTGFIIDRFGTLIVCIIILLCGCGVLATYLTSTVWVHYAGIVLYLIGSCYVYTIRFPYSFEFFAAKTRGTVLGIMSVSCGFAPFSGLLLQNIKDPRKAVVVFLVCAVPILAIIGLLMVIISRRLRLRKGKLI